MRPARIGKRLLQVGPECLEIDNPTIGLELITEVAQPLKPIIEIKKARLVPHRYLHPVPSEQSNHNRPDLARLIEAPSF